MFTYPITFQTTFANGPGGISNGLELWLDVADASTVTASSSFISQIDDKSEYERHATEVAQTRQPILVESEINGKNVAAFDGIADALPLQGTTMDFFHTTGEFDVILVFRPDITGFRYLIGNTNTTLETGMYLGITSGNILNMAITKSVSGQTIVNHNSSFTLTLGEWALVEIRGDGTTSYMSNDMSTFASKAFTSTLGSGSANRTFSIGSTRIGTSGGIGFTDCAIAEVIMYNRDLSTSERADVKTYITNKYGL